MFFCCAVPCCLYRGLLSATLQAVLIQVGLELKVEFSTLCSRNSQLGQLWGALVVPSHLYLHVRVGRHSQAFPKTCL